MDLNMAPMLDKEMSKIDWNNKTAIEIKNLVRGLDPIMGTYSYLDGKKIKIWKVDVLEDDNSSIENGTVIKADSKDGLYIKAKDGILKVFEIQGENAKRMKIEEERKAFSKDYSSEAEGAMGKAIDAMQAEINDTSWDWSHPFKSLGSMFSGDWSWKAKYASFDVGTNYVPNDGFAMIHKGEAIIPKDENIWARQGKAWDNQFMVNDQMLNAINRLEQTMAQGINIKGEFKQRGNDLVATVEKVKIRNGKQPLNNSVFAR